MRYLKTEAGQLAFKQRSNALSPRQRSVFLLFDGNRTAADVLASTAGLGSISDDVTDLVAKGFLIPAEPLATPAAPDAATSPNQASTSLSTNERYRLAYPIATRLTASLGLRGFKLNLAVEAASGYDDLVALLPKLTEAVGPTAVQELKKALQVA